MFSAIVVVHGVHPALSTQSVSIAAIDPKKPCHMLCIALIMIGVIAIY